MKLKHLLIVAITLFSGRAGANVLINGNFEASSLNGWTATGTSGIAQKGLVAGSAQSAQIVATSGKIVQSVSNIGQEWMLDFYVACQNPTLYAVDRSFNLNVNPSQLNMRIAAGGAIQFYNGSTWVTVGNGNEISFSSDGNNDGDLVDTEDTIRAHRIRIVAHNYGISGANYDVYASTANSTVLKLVARGINYFQTTPTAVNSLVFTSAYGMKAPQSYLLDECLLSNLSSVIVTQTGGTTLVEEKNETSDTLLVSLSTQPEADVTVQIAEKPTASYLTISPAQLTFTPQNFDVVQKIAIKAKDDLVQQNGLYTSTVGFAVTSTDTTYQGQQIADITVTIKDNDAKLVYPRFSGIYPHLAMTNSDSECGVGAVVPWQNDLWYVTYSAHYPNGSDDKLYQLDTTLTVTARPESVGGTPANRMIHRESNQLMIGSHIIDSLKRVRTIPPALMPGRMTANARHLTDPANRIYFITMEEGIYDVDVKTLDFKTLHADVNTTGVKSLVPGQHMKGGYVGQNRLMIANNGVGGVLAEWKGDADGDPNLPASWTLIDVNKHTEITTKGGIYGATSQSDPVWSLGWDKRSVLLNVCDNGGIWKRYRLPKASYTHDADHGWYTEWPRIRDIGYNNGNYLMNMHGLMYQFPAAFSHNNTGGIKPFSTFLKMIVDYAEWNGKIVLGCNDATKFANGICPRDQSNLIFTTREELADFGGTPYGFGGIWMNDSVKAGVPSEAMLINGYETRVIHLAQNTGKSAIFTLEVDVNGSNEWSELTRITVPASGYTYYILPSKLNAQWLRVVSDTKVQAASAYVYLANPYCSPVTNILQSVPTPTQKTAISSGVIRPMAAADMKLQFAADIVDETGAISKTYYEIDGNMNFIPVSNPSADNILRTTYAPTKDFTVDNASVVMTSGGKQYRLPMGDATFNDPLVSGYARGIREIVTERSVMNIHGSFYELPRDDAGGFIKIRPITTHNKQIYDFCSWRGMLVLSGNFTNATNDAHYRKTADGKAGLWFGNVDDLFKMGTPKGIGSTWKETSVVANTPSLPYLMQGYADKKAVLSHNLSETVNFTFEVDYMADGKFVKAFTVPVKAGETVTYTFPTGFNAQWVRTSADMDCIASATFYYNTEVPGNTSVMQAADNELLIFPNPATETLNIQGLDKPTTVSVFAVPGTRVLTATVTNQLNVGHLSPGIYMLMVPGRKPYRFLKK